MASDQGQTGTRDAAYDVVSVLYHALQGAETCGKYLGDAEREGDNELAQFLREAQQQQRQIADRAKGLLAKRLGGGGGR